MDTWREYYCIVQIAFCSRLGELLLTDFARDFVFFFVGGVFSLLQSRSNALGVIYLYMVVATAHLKRGGGQIFFRWERERYRGW